MRTRIWQNKSRRRTIRTVLLIVAVRLLGQFLQHTHQFITEYTQSCTDATLLDIDLPFLSFAWSSADCITPKGSTQVCVVIVMCLFFVQGVHVFFCRMLFSTYLHRNNVKEVFLVTGMCNYVEIY